MSSGGGSPAVLPAGCGQRPSPAAGSPESVPANRGCPWREPARCSASVPLAGPVGLLCCKGVVLTPRYQPGGGSCWWESSPCGCLGAPFAHRVTLAFSHRDAEGSSTLPVPHPRTKSLLETPSSCNPIPASSVLLPGPAQGCGNRFVRAPCQAELQKGGFFFPFPRRDDNSHTSTAF